MYYDSEFKFVKDITKLPFSFNINDDLEMLKDFRAKELEDEITLEQNKPIKNTIRITELKRQTHKWANVLYSQYIKDYEIYKDLFYSHLKSQGIEYKYAFECKERDDNIIRYLRKIRRYSKYHIELESTAKLVSKEFNIFEQHIRGILSRILYERLEA